MAKSHQTAFQIKSVEIAESELRLPNIKNENTETFQFSIKVEHRFIIEKQLVLVNVDILVTDTDKFRLGSIKTGCIFELKDFENYLNPEKTEAKLPEDLIGLLNSISISTSRGVMFTHFRGTHLHNAILPIINPADFKKEK